MKILGRGRSRSIKCIWAAEEAGLAYEYHSVDMPGGEHKSEAFRKMNPAMKVPVLVEGTFILSESQAICTYIGVKRPDSLLIPVDGTRERASYDQWMSYISAELEQPLWLQAKHTFALPEAIRLPLDSIKKVAAFEWEKALVPIADRLDVHLFVLGDSFSMADVALGYTLDWAKRAGFSIENAKVNNYLDRMLSRPAYLRALTKVTV